MSIFYKLSKYRKMRKFLQKKHFTLREGGSHVIAIHPTTEEVISIPRHTSLSNGLTKAICEQLVAMGYDADEVNRAIL